MDLQDLLFERLAGSLERPLPVLTPRTAHGTVRFPGKATAVIGMRRAGKTTFLHQLRMQQLAAGVPQQRLPFLMLEDERWEVLDADVLGAVVESYYRTYPDLRGAATVHWSFDEIQNVRGWERFVRRMLDDEHCEITVSGSSAALLSREVATSLRGRGWTVVLHPFSFEEVLRHKGVAQKLLTPRTAAARSRLESEFASYLRVGGFPEAQGLTDDMRMQLLRDYVDITVLRDVVERHEVSQVTALRWMIRHLLGNAGGSFSIERFHGALKSQGIAAGRDALHELLAHLTDCFLVRTVWMEAASERQRMVNPRKAYPIDPALIPVFDRTGRANIGHALEAVVLIELERRGAEVTWVRTPGGFEVDFLARYRDGAEELVQVAADVADPETFTREVRALEDAAPAHPRARRTLLVGASAPLRVDIPHGIDVRPASRWLLDPSPAMG
jgi:predicted AAA+ superfamily ATPase